MMGVSEITPSPIRPSQFSRRSLSAALTERIVVVLLLSLFVSRALIPSWNHLGSDFANYYLVARLYRNGYPVERVYEWTWFQRQKDHAGIERPLVGFAPSPLTSSLLVLPVSSVHPLQANRVWLVMSLGLLLWSAALFKRMTVLPWRRIGLIVFLAVSPLHTNFLLGQVHLVILFLLTVAAWLYFTDRHFCSGIAVAAAAALKIYPALFLVFFLLKRQWRAAAGVVAGTTIAVLLSIRLFGLDACAIYCREILPWGLRGEIIDPYAIGWDSLNSLLRRLFIFEPELNPAPVAHAPYLYAFLHSTMHVAIFVIFLWAIISKSATGWPRQKLEWAAYCFLLLLLSSEPLSYHFVLLILSAVLLADYLTIEGRAGWKWTVGVLYALACLPYDRVYRLNPRGWFSLLVFPRLYCMLLLAGALVYILVTSQHESVRNRLRSSLAYAAIACVTMTVAGVAINLRHLRGQFDNYKTRVTTSVGSAIAVDPVVTAQSVLYGALAPTFSSKHDAYVIHRIEDHSIISCGGGGDWFHPAATIDGRTMVAEVAAANRSSIVQFEPSTCLQSKTPNTVRVSDGEQPIMSEDGGTLAYIRESRGRGSLFTTAIHRMPDGSGSERQLAGPEYDVREAAFSPTGEIMFSSWRDRKYRLYIVEPQSNAVAEMVDISCSARYPAFSPDGDWLAFSCESGGFWQIAVRDRRTQEQRLLTSTECNSVTPAWAPDSKSLIYATDCGRALGITALSTLRLAR